MAKRAKPHSSASRRKPARRTRRQLLGGLVAVALIAGGAFAYAELVGLGLGPGDAWVEIRGQRVAVDVADTPAKKALGLGGRDGLAPDTGMVFPYARPDYHAFWMKGMNFDIDILWIRDGRIVDIRHRVPYPRDGRLPSYSPKAPADLVLEVDAGYARAHGWRIGDRVTVRLGPDG